MTTTTPDDERSTDDEQPTAPELSDRGHPDDDEWTKHTDDLLGSIDAATFSAEFGGVADDPDFEDLHARVEVLPSDADVVNLDFEVSGELRSYPFRYGAIQQLTPEQADALAAALQSAAEQARLGGVGDLE